MLKIVKKLILEEEGQGLTEYGLIIALVAIGCVAALVALRDELTSIFQDDIVNGLNS